MPPTPSPETTKPATKPAAEQPPASVVPAQPIAKDLPVLVAVYNSKTGQRESGLESKLVNALSGDGLKASGGQAGMSPAILKSTLNEELSKADIATLQQTVSAVVIGQVANLDTRPATSEDTGYELGSSLYICRPTLTLRIFRAASGQYTATDEIVGHGIELSSNKALDNAITKLAQQWAKQNHGKF
jgi:hypothetical protein